jgi:hypothetical protein
MPFRKDQSLDELARVGNVAQFVSFAPEGMTQQYSRIVSYEPNHRFGSAALALDCLLERSPEHSINLRSFTPESPQSRHFHYGITSAAEAHGVACKLSSEGLFVIANETVDVGDGGVSGVSQGGAVEFAPDDTPRCVEKAGVASLPEDWGSLLLRKVYGFHVHIINNNRGRTEFSIHPKPRGWKNDHTLMWEYDPFASERIKPSMEWPNRFSRHIGDKSFGLLVAEIIGLPVPQTTVISRRVAPFTFGQPTGSSEVWLRTCPGEPEPGRFTTQKGWIDPFRLLNQEDPDGKLIPSVLCQSAISAKFSGAAIPDINDAVLVEGAKGEGDRFMLGQHAPQRLPSNIIDDVKLIYGRASEILGPVRFEWVHDGRCTWVVQLHRGGTESIGSTLVPGEPTEWATFEATKGLEALRVFLAGLPDHAGVTIEGEIGLTSHIADLLRKSRRPARLSRLAHV